jgi:hypothetical protein
MFDRREAAQDLPDINKRASSPAEDLAVSRRPHAEPRRRAKGYHAAVSAMPTTAAAIVTVAIQPMMRKGM